MRFEKDEEVVEHEKEQEITSSLIATKDAEIERLKKELEGLKNKEKKKNKK